MALIGQRVAGFGLWAGIPLLQAAGLAGLIAAHAPSSDARVLAIVFPPWWTEDSMVSAVRGQGLVPLPAGAAFIAIVPDAVSLRSIPGEWFRLSLPKGIFCSEKESIP